MIEYCTKKRMLLACGFLIAVSTLVIVMENKLSGGSHRQEISQSLENTSQKPCWEEAQMEIVEQCAPCNKYESKIYEYCHKTDYKEKVKCLYDDKEPTELFRSCPKLGWLEERNFWAFESMTLLVGAVSYAMVYTRQKHLDQNLADKVNKQIAAGV